jgi:hypothetical protein
MSRQSHTSLKSRSHTYRLGTDLRYEPTTGTNARGGEIAAL